MEGDSQRQDAVDVHKPFTKAERIHQLAEIDSDIALLLTHTGNAIQALGQSVSTGASHADGISPSEPAPMSIDGSDEAGRENQGSAPLKPEARLASFNASMNAFMKTLHAVDVRLKRHIWGLEEAGIITLKSAERRELAGEGGGPGGTAAADTGAAAAAVDAVLGDEKPSLEPNGVGNIGSLDVGWLNARSNKVDRVMENELWTAAKKHLQGVADGTEKASVAALGLGPGQAPGGAGRERMEE
ncbi:hypothetical protein VTK73DRAFT_9595 [Phialemonium thermophilum]|uniref:Mediator of RNA polymerase II transcription subunit 11 n=1 Tax=Phialemonium thermophilum TaxID=223376 RepID=A0ABR3W1F6_9PEZI